MSVTVCPYKSLTRCRRKPCPSTRFHCTPASSSPTRWKPNRPRPRPSISQSWCTGTPPQTCNTVRTSWLANVSFPSLWGRPLHLNHVASALREKYPEDKLHILNAKRNAGSFTYDGVELGGERVAQEIEETLEELARAGQTITKISMIGYSLGGLVARYAIGLLYHKGWFDKLEPVNFTTFATPHLGVRTPLLGYHNHLWNVIGAKLLSESGRQLFTVDKFRDTGRPLLGVLADPSSVFMRALALFKNRSLYANIVNDRSAVYYTTSISTTDPFVKPDDVKINYVRGYEDIIIDGENPVSPKDEEALYRGYDVRGLLLKRVPLYGFLAVFLPLAFVIFSASSVVQNAKSKKRIQLHEAGQAGIAKGLYRIPLMIQDARQMGEDMYENVANAQDQEYLPEGRPGEIDAERSESPLLPPPKGTGEAEKAADGPKKDKGPLDFPTLALTPEQFAMVKALDDVGWRKHPVHIHSASHSHAAIIVRSATRRFDDGKVVVRHWLERFEI